MNHIKNLISSFSALLLLLAPLSFITIINPQLASAGANQCTWTGGGADDNWSTDANWVCSVGTGPATGYDLIFPFSNSPGDSYGDEVNNDLPDTNEYAGIWFTDASGCPGFGYSIIGNGFSLAGDITYTNDFGCVKNTGFGTGDINFTSDSVIITAGSIISFNQQFLAPIGSGTVDSNLNIGANNLTLDAGSAGFVGIADGRNISGSGEIIVTGSDSTSVWLSSSNDVNPSFNGIWRVQGGVYLQVGFPGVLGSGQIIVEDTGKLQFNTDTAGTYTVSNNINSSSSAFPVVTVRGFNDVAFPSGYLSSSSQYGSAWDPTTTYNFTGNISLSNDLTFSTEAMTNLTGALSGSNNIDIAAGYYGMYLNIDGSSNTTLTPNGLYRSFLNNVVLSDSLPSETVGINNGGVITINGVRSSVGVYNGGILMGTGTIGNLTSSRGILRPGLSPGVMNTGNLDFDSATVMDAELEGTGAGQHDQFNVTGTVSLGSATLNTILFNGYAPNISDSFTIINNDGTDAITGTFAGLAEGAEITVSNFKFTISYVGGTGNDVVLTTTYVPGPPGTGFDIYQNSLFVPAVVILSGLGLVAFAQRRRLNFLNKR